MISALTTVTPRIDSMCASRERSENSSDIKCKCINFQVSNACYDAHFLSLIEDGWVMVAVLASHGDIILL